jgi:hypothetical protein
LRLLARIGSDSKQARCQVTASDARLTRRARKPELQPGVPSEIFPSGFMAIASRAVTGTVVRKRLFWLRGDVAHDERARGAAR